jgi:catechol 2,3-dioxygenase-like lactoylglutathione lyase family enzyme
MKLELIAVPVSDVDRAKTFYVDQVGFIPDHDHTLGEDVRFVQLTPPGSACSIAIGIGITRTAPGSAAGITLVVPDIDTARAELAGRGVSITEVQDMPWGARHAHFTDPDGNPWDLQEVPSHRA